MARDHAATDSSAGSAWGLVGMLFPLVFWIIDGDETSATRLLAAATALWILGLTFAVRLPWATRQAPPTLRGQALLIFPIAVPLVLLCFTLLSHLDAPAWTFATACTLPVLLVALRRARMAHQAS